jgi:hypothetical protein
MENLIGGRKTSYHGAAAGVITDGRKLPTAGIDSGRSTVQVKHLIFDPVP